MTVNSQIVFRKEFDGTGLLFNPDNGETFGLNSIAVVIWEELVRGSGRDQILKRLDEVTALPPEGSADLDEFLQNLQAHGFLLSFREKRK